MYEELDDLKAKLDKHRPFTEKQQTQIDDLLIPRRIYYTNTFEDNSLTLEDTKYYLQTSRMVGGKLEREFQEIKGVLEAIKFLRELIGEKKDIQEETIKELHLILTKPINQDDRYHPGEYRTQDSIILGKEGSRINFASHNRISGEMKALLTWYSSKSKSLHPLETAARFHYRFSLIHPFSDGNGRIARLLDDFILENAGYGPAIAEDRDEYFATIRQPDGKLPAKNRIIASEQVDLTGFINALGKSCANSMKLMLDILEKRLAPEVKDMSTRLMVFDQVISGDTASDKDLKLQETKETTKLAIGREISEKLKNKIQSKYVQFVFSGPAKFQQNDHQYSPLISEITRRHKYTFSPSESLYEFHLVPNLEKLEDASMPLEPFMKLLSIAVISHQESVGVFSAILSFEFGRVYIKQENRDEIVLRLEKDSIREYIGNASYEEWDIKVLHDFIFNSIDTFLQRIETDYLKTKKNTE